MNSTSESSSKNKGKNSSDTTVEDIDEEEQRFLQKFVFLKGFNKNKGSGMQDEESSLENRLKTISRPKSFDVKKSFTEDVGYLQLFIYFCQN